MIDPASRALPFGPLEVTEVFTFYEFPRLFALRSTRFAYLNVLALCIDEDEEAATADFIYAALNRDEFSLIRSGAVTFRSWLDRHGEQLWLVTWTFEGQRVTAHAHPKNVQEFDPADLPAPDARLFIPTATAREFNPVEDVDERATAMDRTVMALELESDTQTVTSFPLRELGRIEVALQDFATAIGQRQSGASTAFGRVAGVIEDACRLSALAEPRAASFVVLITPDLETTSSFMEDPLIAPVLAEVTDLLSLCQSGKTESLQEAAKGQGPRVRGRLSDLLDALTQARSSLAVELASPALQGRKSARLSFSEAVAARAIIGSIKPTTTDVHLKRAVLMGYDAGSHHFHLEDLVTGSSYEGRADDETAMRLATRTEVGEGALVTARLVESQTATVHESEPRRYELVYIAPLEGEPLTKPSQTALDDA